MCTCCLACFSFKGAVCVCVCMEVMQLGDLYHLSEYDIDPTTAKSLSLCKTVHCTHKGEGGRE